MSEWVNASKSWLDSWCARCWSHYLQAPSMKLAKIMRFISDSLCFTCARTFLSRNFLWWTQFNKTRMNTGNPSVSRTIRCVGLLSVWIFTKLDEEGVSTANRTYPCIYACMQVCTFTCKHRSACMHLNNKNVTFSSVGIVMIPIRMHGSPGNRTEFPVLRCG